MRLDQIWRYPVKSMHGARVQSAALAADGIADDRVWALRDEQRGAIASARKVGSISRLAASAVEAAGVAVITLPGGATVRSDDPDASERLSAALGHPVSLWSRRTTSDPSFWARGRPDSDDLMTELRAVFGRTEEEPLPDFSVFPPEMLEYEYPPGTFYDCYPLMIMTTSALRSLRAALPDSAIDERRFRPSLVVDTGDAEGHPELAWTGRRLRIGTAEVQVGAACPRCVTITREFADDLPADRRVLRHVVRDLNQNVGVYATIAVAGTLHEGDRVELL